MTVSEKKVTLVLSDGSEITVAENIICVSKTINDQISECRQNALIMQNDQDYKVPISNPKCNQQNLKWIIEWATYYVDHKNEFVTSDEDKFRSEIVNEFDKQFIAKIPIVGHSDDNNNIFSLIVATNYLDIPLLLCLCCKTVANCIKQYTPDEIKERFRIPSLNNTVTSPAAAASAGR